MYLCSIWVDYKIEIVKPSIIQFTVFYYNHILLFVGVLFFLLNKSRIICGLVSYLRMILNTTTGSFVSKYFSQEKLFNINLNSLWVSLKSEPLTFECLRLLKYNYDTVETVSKKNLVSTIVCYEFNLVHDDTDSSIYVHKTE